VHRHGPEASARADRRALGGALGLVVAFMVVEVVAGLAAGSLALLADAGHMLADSFALGLALFASWIAGRPRTPARSFGYQRAEILAALTNAVLLVAIAIWIFIEAYGRLRDPPDVLAGWVLAVGALGLIVNLAAAVLLSRASGESLNRRAALRHVLADGLGSAGVVAAAAIVLATGWREADPLVSVLIGLLVLASSWTILRESVGILLEATPRGVDAEEVGRAMAGADGVQEVHDLHIWTITSGFPSLSAHVLVAPGADCHGIRLELERLLGERFGLTHTTLQVEHAAPQRIELRRSARSGG
jgi:cobalt-zinc-cadmium efflux system protein